MRKGRVYNSTKNSDIIYIYKYIKFYLSSDFNYERMSKVQNYIDLEIQKLKNRYDQNMPDILIEHLENYLAMYYYKKIEQRGHRIEFLYLIERKQ